MDNRLLTDRILQALPEDHGEILCIRVAPYDGDKIFVTIAFPTGTSLKRNEDHTQVWEYDGQPDIDRVKRLYHEQIASEVKHGLLRARLMILYWESDLVPEGIRKQHFDLMEEFFGKECVKSYTALEFLQEHVRKYIESIAECPHCGCREAFTYYDIGWVCEMCLYTWADKNPYKASWRSPLKPFNA